MSSVPLPKKKIEETHEAWLIELAPGIDYHDLDQCRIKLPQISCPQTREAIVQDQTSAEQQYHNFEDPLMDTPLEDGSRVRKIKHCAAGSSSGKLLYTSTATSSSNL